MFGPAQTQLLFLRIVKLFYQKKNSGKLFFFHIIVVQFSSNLSTFLTSYQNFQVHVHFCRECPTT